MTTALENHAEMIEYRVALLDSASDRLVVEPDRGTFRLPRLKIPKWTRIAEEINRAVFREWNLNSFVLDFLQPPAAGSPCAVGELLTPFQITTANQLEAKDLKEVDASDLTASEGDFLSKMIAGENPSSGPFSRRGWLREAKAWIKDCIPGRNIEFTDDVQQYNASDSFALLRLNATDGSSYWLKATGKPNEHECSLTVGIAEIFPALLPRVVAMREDWNAWITEDIGMSLNGTRDLGLVTGAVRALADLQIESIKYISCIGAAGAMNRPLSSLQFDLPEMFSFLEEAMAKQSSTKVKPLAPSRLHEIRSVVDEACSEMEQLKIPDTLVNGDINLDNILFDGIGYRFIDWAEGGIGSPFLTLQQLIQHVIRDGEHEEWVPALCGTYRAKWLPLIDSCAIDRAISLMPLLTMADYLHGRGDWLHSERRDQPAFQSFARTLARCMDRAAAELISGEALSS